MNTGNYKYKINMNIMSSVLELFINCGYYGYGLKKKFTIKNL